MIDFELWLSLKNLSFQLEHHKKQKHQILVVSVFMYLQ